MSKERDYFIAAATFVAVPAAGYATGWFDGGGRYYPNLTSLRLATILASTGSGFVLGWLLSPEASRIRQVAVLAGAALLFTKAVLDNGAMGWPLTMLTATFGFAAGLGWWLRRWTTGFFEPPNTFGSAKWATAAHLEENGVFGDTGLRFGSFPTERGLIPLHYEGDRHVLVVAPTRSGKGTTLIVPNLLTYGGPSLVIDVKGENAMITAARRKAMGQAIHVVDPFGIVDLPGHAPARFNPLDMVDEGDVDMPEKAMELADCLVVEEGAGDPFWNGEAKGLLQGLVVYVKTDPREAGQRHLGRVRDLLLLDAEDQAALFERMMESPHHVVASTGARCAQKDEKLLSNVVASAQAQTHFLDSARIRESLAASDFSYGDLKRTPMTVYLVLPADRLSTFGRWLRLHVQTAITVSARDIANKPEKPILFILDEMVALGRLTMVEQAYSLMSGYGMLMFGVAQDLSQLKRIYGDAYEGFIANSGVIAYFGSRDRMTSDYMSAICGVTTVWNLSSAIARSVGKSGPQGNVSQSNTDTTAAAQRKLAYPDELMRIDPRRGLLFVEHLDPIRTVREPWFENPALKHLGRNLHDKS